MSGEDQAHIAPQYEKKQLVMQWDLAKCLEGEAQMMEQLYVEISLMKIMMRH